jgi:starch synthase
VSIGEASLGFAGVDVPAGGQGQTTSESVDRTVSCDLLFATAEIVPVAKIGGLAEAAAGLVRDHRESGMAVEVVIPDYGNLPYPPTETWTLPTPGWVGGAFARRLDVPALGNVVAVSVPDLHRPHPYVDPVTGWGWGDNDRRFIAFSAAVAALSRVLNPGVVHLNDWHTAAAAAWIDRPVVLALHNVSHQGWCSPGWLDLLGPAYEQWGGCNLLAGGIRLADRVIAVSEAYADEVTRPDNGMGLDGLLSARGRDLIGIRNGIDTSRWDPLTDRLLPAAYSAADMTGKRICTKELLRTTGIDGGDGPVIGVVARLVYQKGIDLALAIAPYLATMPAVMVVVGDGEPQLAQLAREVAHRYPTSLWAAGYSDELAHLLVAGADLLLAPSRFEPCGLTQMEAMAYGTLPIVTGVGGLRNTVVDADQYPESGCGWIAPVPDPISVMDATHRAVRGWADTRRRQAMQLRGMRRDWSWRLPAAAYRAVYSGLSPAS